MIEVHHLNESRSRRIIWMLEELDQPYVVIRYERDNATRLAPPELTRIHALGKAPVLRDNDLVLVESGAILDYLIRQYGQGRFAPAMDSRVPTAMCNSCTMRKVRHAAIDAKPLRRASR